MGCKAPFSTEGPPSQRDGYSLELVLSAPQPWPPRPTHLKRRTTASDGSWMPTGTRWSCWSRRRSSCFGRRKTWLRTSRCSSCSRRCKACSRYLHLCSESKGHMCSGEGGWWEAGGEKRTAEKLSGGIRKVPMMFCGRRGSGEKPHKEIGCSINNYTLQVGNKGRESKALKAPHGKCSPLANG